MTEHLMLLDPSSIQAVRVQCVACGAAVSHPLNQPIDLLTKCPACGAAWHDRQRPGDVAETLRGVADMFERLNSERVGQSGVRLKFELNPMKVMSHGAPSAPPKPTT